MGLESIDLTKRTKCNTIMRAGLTELLEKDNLGEELRVLYVALTRAKEKLILTGTLAKAQEKIEKLQSRLELLEHPLTYTKRRNAVTYLDWLLPVFFKQPQKYPVHVVTVQQLENEELSVAMTQALQKESMHAVLAQKDAEMEEQVARRLEYEYPYQADLTLRTKKSVSELKHRAMEQSGEDEMEFLAEEVVVPYIPQFIQSSQEVNLGAMRGTAMHRVMECFDFTKELSRAELHRQIAAMQEQGRLKEEQTKLLVRHQLEQFLSQDVAKRMHEAALSGRYYSEQPFVMGVPAKEIEDTTSEELILVQGIIDVFWEEEDGLVLLDYKTDSVADMHQLKLRYQEQLRLYAKAIAAAFQKPVKEAYIYSFRFGEAMELLEQ
jgi:ATP-dependent helicase/nuclease subunit A